MGRSYLAPAGFALVVSTLVLAGYLSPTDRQSGMLTMPSITENAFKETAKSARFIFVAGVEGSGHHFMSSLLKDSPALQRVNELGLLDELSEILEPFGLQNPYKYERGLLNAQCTGTSSPIKSRIAKPMVKDPRNKVVDILKNISDAVGEESIAIPINSNGYMRMNSYPAYGGECRSLNYPNLDLFYDVCDEAGVQCSHVYLYRDPYDIIRSTSVRRHFNRGDIVKATHLYSSMLNIMFAQFWKHSSRTAGCFGLFDASQPTEESWDTIRDMFGWSSENGEFEEMLEGIYKAPTKMSDEEREAMVPAEYDIYMRSMIAAHENLLHICREQVRNNSNQ